MLIFNFDRLFLGTAIFLTTYISTLIVLLIFEFKIELVKESIFDLFKLTRDVRLNKDELKLVFTNRVKII